jgi:CHAT domain-containing protein
VIIPAARLQYLPFETLIGPNGSFLIEQYDVSYLPSLTVLGALSVRAGAPTSRSRLVAFGDPTRNGAALDSLPYAARELDSLVAIFGEDHVQVYSGEDATALNFKIHDFTEDRYIHIASHGITDDRHPGSSALILSPASTGQDDGRLQASEIANLRIPADLAFLAACRTGGGKSFPGEGVLSLVQPFLVAGCRSVVVSYWDVFDRYAAELIPRFYRYHLEGYSNVRSLTLAKRDLLRTKSSLARHPYFWAPYVLVGDTDRESVSGDPLRKRNK